MSSDREDGPRERVVLLLGLLSSPECQETCVGDRRSREELAFVLCRVWVDEIFVPGLRYVDGWKGDRDEEAAERFWAPFDAEEREALERFHRFVELRLEMLPEEARREERIPAGDRWENLMRDAGNTLEALEPDGDRLRGRLERVVRAIAAGETGAGTDGIGWTARLTD